jgi:3-oxoacyl-[acyl-carrier-protein] synthase II
VSRRVVVTGLGAVSPLGLNLESTWRAICEGQSGVRPITLFRASSFPFRIAAEVLGYSPDLLTPEERGLIKYLNRPAQFAMLATRQAMETAALPAGMYAPARLGIIVGCSGSRPDLQTVGALCRDSAGGGAVRPAVDPVAFLNRSHAAGVSVLASLYNAQGPTLTVSTACAAGSQAIGMGFRAIQRGDAEVMITGGYDSLIGEVDMLGFSLLGALSTRNDEPERASRPFDRDRDGFVIGEGAAILVLEERANALARRARIFAEVAGYGESMTAYRITDSPPDGDGAWQAIAGALADAKVAPEEVDYINAHGTSTLQNDRSETVAIKRAFGEAAYRVPVSSTKSMTGHLVGAAGAMELAFCVCAIEDQVIPPTINYEHADPRCDLDYVPNRARKAPVRVALSNSFAFGGNSAALLVRDHAWESAG